MAGCAADSTLLRRSTRRDSIGHRLADLKRDIVAESDAVIAQFSVEHASPAVLNLLFAFYIRVLSQLDMHERAHEALRRSEVVRAAAAAATVAATRRHY